MTDQHTTEADLPEEPYFSIPRGVALFLLLLTSGVVLHASWVYLFTEGASFGDDNSSHFAVIYALAQMLKAGQTDLFFDQVNLGVPLFLSYHPFSASLMAVISALTMCCSSPLFQFKLSIVAGWMLMPWTWYIGSRWLGLPRFVALVMGLLILGIQDPFDYGMTFESLAFKGLYAQMFGMLFFPLAVGSIYKRLLLKEGSLFGPVFWLTLTFLSHVFFGLYAGIATLLFLFISKEGEWLRLAQLLLIYALTFALISFWALPLLQHKAHVGGLPFKTMIHNGLPWQKLLSLFLSGKIFDQGRLPWLSVLAAGGLILVLVRDHRQLIGRWTLLLFLVTMLFFLGRTNLGTYYSYIPLHTELNVMRYISGVHVCGVLFASLALYFVWKWLFDWLVVLLAPEAATTMLVLLLCVGASVHLYDRHKHINKRLRIFPVTKEKPYQAVRRYLARKSRGRFLVDSLLGTKNHFHRDLLPALAKKPQLHSYGMTFHATHANYFLESFAYNPIYYRLYNVGTLVTKTKLLAIPSKGLTKALQRPPYTLYHTNAGGGYFDWVQLPLALSAEGKSPLKQLRPTTKGILYDMYARRMLPFYQNKAHPIQSDFALHIGKDGIIQLLDKGKDLARTMTRSSFLKRLYRRTPKKLQAAVLRESHRGNWYKAHVQVSQKEAWLLLKVNYFPYWHATIDGKEVRIQHVAPTMMAVRVPQGTHRVTFAYKNPTWQKALALLSLLVLLIWGGVQGAMSVKQWWLARTKAS